MGSGPARTGEAIAKVRRAGYLAAALFVLAAAAGCKPEPPAELAATVCPRAETIGAAPAPLGQEVEMRDLRRRAFAGDFFSQLELGRRYSGAMSTDKTLADSTEAAVWYAVALANPSGYDGHERPMIQDPWRPSWWDKLTGKTPPPPRPGLNCRDEERVNAYTALDSLLRDAPEDLRAELRRRVTYVLASRGGAGLALLGRIYDQRYVGFGAPADDVVNGQGFDSAARLFTASDADAWIFYYLAAQTRDTGAYIALKQFEDSTPDRKRSRERLLASAERWTPPYELYPPDAPFGALAHSDESAPDPAALALIGRVPFVHIGRAMHYLGLTPGVAARPEALTATDVIALHKALGLPANAPLTALDRLRVLQLAATRGSAEAQLMLAVMYAEGVGVPKDYARAFRWFTAAADQGQPAAMAALSAMSALGIEGVVPQNAAAALVQRFNAALSGYRPSLECIQDMLNTFGRTPRANAK